MQSESTRIYFKRLITEGHEWQYTDIAGNINKPKFYFTRIQWIILTVAVFGTPFLLKGFNKEFVSYTLTALSIFVGLFLTLILSAFDKFKSLNIERPSYEEQRYIKTRSSFFKQFIALTAYAIILSLLSILLLGIVSLVDPFFCDSILNHPISNRSTESVFRFLKVLFKTVYNGTIVYFLLDFFVLVIYAVTSIHSYMRVELDK